MLPDVSFLLRHDRPGPRYTSYPTAPQWSPEPPEDLLEDGLAGLDPDAPVSVYVHVPFCEEQCLYCGCNMVVARRRDAGDRFLDALARQVTSLPVPGAMPMVRLHLGGGTPTWLSPDQLRTLFQLLDMQFEATADVVRSLEADPMVTTAAHLDMLAQGGISRLSFGVQSFDEDVLAAVNRPQSHERVATLVAQARERGIHAINLDLMYGLPGQTPESFKRTLDAAIALNPSRLAVFGYAHVPWMKPHQARLDATRLPDTEARADMLLLAQRRLQDAGYAPVGFDHFALPDDPLAIASAQGTLGRDFMGYTARPPSALIGLGPSAISQLDDRFAQQEPRLGKWWKEVEAGRLPVTRGMRLSADDRLRRDVIMALVCNGRVDLDEVAARHGEQGASYFRAELRALRPLVEEGIVDVVGATVSVPDMGRLLVRNVAMVFDAYLSDRQEGRFSRVV